MRSCFLYLIALVVRRVLWPLNPLNPSLMSSPAGTATNQIPLTECPDRNMA